MDYITSWIREIILLILMAVLLELLLPNSTLQRYVRMVVGLLLLLALLKPVLSVFDTNVNDMLSVFSSSAIVSDDQIKNSIKSQKKEIQASQRAYIEKQMGVQWKKQAQKEVSDRFRMDVDNVEVTLDDLQFGRSRTNIKKVTVYLSKQVKDKQGKTDPVKPVTVDVSKGPDQSSDDNGKNGKAGKIRTFLAKQWKLPRTKITVVLEAP